jgi:trigger factor
MSDDDSAATGAVAAGPQFHVEETSSVVRTIVIDVSADAVDAAFDRAYRDLARRVRVAGFRPGKAPRSVLQRLYGSAIGEDIERVLVSESLPGAIERSGLVPVVEPTIEASEPSAGQRFRYSARIELKPEIPLPALEGLPARRLPLTIGELEIEKALDDLRERHARLVEEPDDVIAARGHVLGVDFEGQVDGQPFEGGHGEGVSVELGAGRFLPGFEEQLEGARAGERRTVRVQFPESYGRPDLAGKEAVFEVSVTAIRRRELPSLDDEFAKDVGEFESLAQLRERVVEDLRSARERDANQLLRRSLLDALLERTKFEVPPGLVERRLQGRLSAAHREFEHAVPHDLLHQQLARWQEEWRPLAERDVRETLVLEAVARAREITVDDTEVDARIDRMAHEQGTEAKKLRKAYREANLVEAVRAQIADERAVEALAREAKIEEVAAP